MTRLDELRSRGLGSPRTILRLWVLLLGYVSLMQDEAWGQAHCEAGSAPLVQITPPNFNQAEVIARFAANEAASKQAMSTYGYDEDLTIQSLSEGRTDGEYRVVSRMAADGAGKIVRTAISPAQDRLERVRVTSPDLEAIRHRMRFMLPTEDLPAYELRFLGTQRVDDLDTEVFSVTPAPSSTGERLQGRLWVDAVGAVVVMTCGRMAGGAGNAGDVVLSVYREQIDGRYWFPTYVRAEGTLHVGLADVLVRETGKFTNYRRVVGLAGH